MQAVADPKPAGLGQGPKGVPPRGVAASSGLVTLLSRLDTGGEGTPRGTCLPRPGSGWTRRSSCVPHTSR
jgi:hypothetical protein